MIKVEISRDLLRSFEIIWILLRSRVILRDHMRVCDCKSTRMLGGTARYQYEVSARGWVTPRTARSHPLACEESPSFEVFSSCTIFINNFQAPCPILMIFSEKNLYVPGILWAKFEACGSISFGVIVNWGIFQGVPYLDATLEGQFACTQWQQKQTSVF